MKTKLSLIGICLVVLVSFCACTTTNDKNAVDDTKTPPTENTTPDQTNKPTEPAPNPENTTEKMHKNGTYRGGYIDPTQIEIEFVLEDNTFKSFKFRSLSYKGTDYLTAQDPPVAGVRKQFEELTAYLTDKKISDLEALYKPEDIASDIDGMTSATLRSSKLISAINDGLNRGPYKLA